MNALIEKFWVTTCLGQPLPTKPNLRFKPFSKPASSVESAQSAVKPPAQPSSPDTTGKSPGEIKHRTSEQEPSGEKTQKLHSLISIMKEAQRHPRE
jgi:hypothetical protein